VTVAYFDFCVSCELLTGNYFCFVLGVLFVDDNSHFCGF
jgi:hypothetical protein